MDNNKTIRAYLKNLASDKSPVLQNNSRAFYTLASFDLMFLQNNSSLFSIRLLVKNPPLRTKTGLSIENFRLKKSIINYP
jgi:hypothetical protein